MFPINLWEILGREEREYAHHEEVVSQMQSVGHLIVHIHGVNKT